MKTYEIALLAFAVSPAIAVLIQLVKDALKSLLILVVNAVFVTMQFDEASKLSGVVIGYLRKKCRYVSLGDDYYVRRNRQVGVRSKSVFFRNATRSFSVFFYKKVPIFVTPFVDKGGKSSDKACTVRFLRGTVDVKGLLRAAGEFYDDWRSDSGTRKFYVMRVAGGGDHKEDKITQKFDSFSIGKEFTEDEEPISVEVEDPQIQERESAFARLSQTVAHKKVYHDVKFWLEHGTWYAKRSLPWRRGYLLHGKPGTGKTSMIRALCEDLDIPIIVMDLSQMTNNQFNAAWESVRHINPRVVLLEDFDTVFKGRDNCSRLGMLDFSIVLNALDGIEQENGLLLFVTTNHAEHIDEALGAPLPDGSTTRPGRLDVSIEIPELDMEGRSKIAERIVDNLVDAHRLAQDHNKESPAKFIEICKQHALQALWEQYKEKAA